ncbi:hypothetical protein BS47DRAFT_1401643 [Hydnum rufescens UP504]|uniref:Uncharacterized protein n=1 Tax=Hydnum rufescens UP504 TaxID=1448309 RepID=A0A9P6AEE7_9AGAM|nr:hypothetical protein BS47DRAFT_1401643 [Hydnum rufescens UP504]
MADNANPAAPSKGKEKVPRVGLQGILLGLEQLVPPKPGNLSKGRPSVGGEALAQVAYAALSDAQKVAILESTVMQELSDLASSPNRSTVSSASVPAIDKTIIARIVVAALAPAPNTPKKVKEPIYSAANFVDLEELERNDVIPTIVDQTIEHQQFCPLSACTAEVSMKYSLNSSAIPSIKKLIGQDDKATEIVDANKLSSSDLTIEKPAWEQGYERLLHVMAKYSNAETLTSLSFLHDFLKAHCYYHLEFPIIARCDLTCRKKFFSSPVDFHCFNLAGAVDVAKDQQMKHDNAKLIHHTVHSQLHTNPTPSYSGNRFNPMASDARRILTPQHHLQADLGRGVLSHMFRGNPRGAPFWSDSAWGPSGRCFCCGAKDHRAVACSMDSHEGGGMLYSAWAECQVA